MLFSNTNGSPIICTKPFLVIAMPRQKESHPTHISMTNGRRSSFLGLASVLRLVLVALRWRIFKALLCLFRPSE